jgi:hypothetical protein
VSRLEAVRTISIGLSGEYVDVDGWSLKRPSRGVEGMEFLGAAGVFLTPLVGSEKAELKDRDRKSWTTLAPSFAFIGMSSFSEQLLRETIRDSFNDEEGGRLLGALDENAPMREDVLTLLAQFKVNLGPFFLRALLDRLDEKFCDGDPLVDALRTALAMPAGELVDKLLGEEGRAA